MSNQTFIKNSAITLFRQFASIIIGIFLVVILANHLGKEGQGNYSLITFVPLMLLTFLNLGLNASTIFFVSKKEIDINTAFSTNIISSAVLGIVSIIIGSLYIFLFKDEFLPAEVDSLFVYLTLLTMPFMFLMMLTQTIFQGLENFKLFNSTLVIQQFSTLLLVVICFYVFDLDLLGALLAFIGGYFISSLYAIIMMIKIYRAKFKVRFFSISYLKKALGYGIKAHISNAMTFLNYRLDTMLLGFFLNPIAVGVYTVAVNLGEKLSIFSQSISSVLLPRVAKLSSENERNKLTSIVSRTVLIFVFLLSAFCFILSDYIFMFFFPEFTESSILFQILLFGIWLLSVEKILSNDLAARGKPEINMYVSFVNVVVNVMLNLWLIPELGVLGAAISSSITYTVSFIIKVIIYSRVTQQSLRSFLLVKKQDIILFKQLFQKIKKRVTA